MMIGWAKLAPQFETGFSMRRNRAETWSKRVIWAGQGITMPSSHCCEKDLNGPQENGKFFSFAIYSYSKIPFLGSVALGDGE